MTITTVDQSTERLEIWLRRAAPIAGEAEALGVIAAWRRHALAGGITRVIGEAGPLRLAAGAEGDLFARARVRSRGRRGGFTHVLRASGPGGASASLLFGLAPGSDSAASAVTRIVLAPAISIERGKRAFWDLAASVKAESGTLGTSALAAPRAGWVTLVSDLRLHPPPGTTLEPFGRGAMVSINAAFEDVSSANARERLDAVRAWLAGESAPPIPAVSPGRTRGVDVPSFLRADRFDGDPASIPALAALTDETRELPRPTELLAMIARAEPRAALAASRPRHAKPRTGEFHDEPAPDAGSTALAPPPEEIRALIARATPFRRSSAGAPMPVDDYAVLRALREVRGDDDESVCKRYGTDLAEERRALDRRMEQHLASSPPDLARFEERLEHFLRLLRGPR